MIISILRNLPGSRGLAGRFLQNASRYSTKSKEPQIPTNPLNKVYTASTQPTNGHVYDKKPFKMRCIAGKTYSWCLCGRSKTQPLCDGTHRGPHWKIEQKPVKFTVTETKEYWICNCKQTANRPFCDGSHLHPDIQEKRL